jgi:nucleoside-diphosphate-sugar epimerase
MRSYKWQGGGLEENEDKGKTSQTVSTGKPKGAGGNGNGHHGGNGNSSASGRYIFVVEDQSLMEVVITGASGYLGQHLTAELIGRGASVRAIVRGQSQATDQAVLKQLGARIFVGQLGVEQLGTQADLKKDQDSSLAQAFTGADCAVHLIGSVAPPRGGPTIDQLHRSYTGYFAQACAHGGVKKAVLVTALGADEKSASQYLASKRLAEVAFVDCLAAANITCTVVRPSLIVGRRVGSRDSKLVERYRTLLNTRPVVPLVGGGGNMLEPVFVGDLACAIATILEQENGGISGNITGQIIEIGGPQRLSMRQFVEALATSMSVKKPMVTLPYSVAALAANLLGIVQDVPLLSADQVKLSAVDMVAAVNSLPQLLAPREPMALAEALATYQARAVH